LGIVCIVLLFLCVPLTNIIFFLILSVWFKRSNKTTLVITFFANSETGSVQPIRTRIFIAPYTVDLINVKRFTKRNGRPVTNDSDWNGRRNPRGYALHYDGGEHCETRWSYGRTSMKYGDGAAIGGRRAGNKAVAAV